MQFVQNYEMKSALTFDIFLFGDPGRFPPPWFNILVIILTQYDADYDDDMDGVNNDNDDHNDISKTILLATPKATTMTTMTTIIMMITMTTMIMKMIMMRMIPLGRTQGRVPLCLTSW